MNSINSSYSEEKEDDEMYQKTSPNEDSNSLLYDEKHFMNDETISENEKNDFYKDGNNNICLYNFEKKRPRNAIDFFNVNSEEYKKKKMFEKVKSKLINLNNLPDYYIDEICNLSWFYSKKLSHKKLDTILPIIVYKIIKKDNINYISLKDLKEKINFRYKTYFQNEKLFNELNENIIKNKKKRSLSELRTYITKEQKYSEIVYNSIIKYITKIKEKSQTHINIIKIKGKKRITKKSKDRSKNNTNNENNNNQIIEKLFSKLSEEENKTNELFYSPLNIELNNCQEQCKDFIYNNNKSLFANNYIKPIHNEIITLNEEEEEQGQDIEKLFDENKFNDYFKNKISSDILGLGMIKYFIDKNKIIILSYRILKEIFNCNIYQVKKSILYIKLYINNINNN